MLFFLCIVVLLCLHIAGIMMLRPTGPQREDDFPPSLSRSWSPAAWVKCSWSLLRISDRALRAVPAATSQGGGQ